MYKYIVHAVHQHHHIVDNQFSFSNITPLDVLESFELIKSKATGPDEIPIQYSSNL